MTTTKEVFEVLRSINALLDYQPNDPDYLDWDEVADIINAQSYYKRQQNGEYIKVPLPEFVGVKLSVVENFGGEGLGDSCFLVFRVENLNGTTQYFKKDGFYASYDGTTWDGAFREVFPKEKIIAVFEDTDEFDSFGSVEYDSFGSD